LAKESHPNKIDLERLRSAVDNPDVLRLLDALAEQLQRESQETARKLGRLAENQRTLDNRILNVENSQLFRLLHRISRHLRGWTSGGALYTRNAKAQSEDRDYKLWLERQELSTPPDQWFNDAIARLEKRPRIGVLMTVDRPRREWLEAAIASIQRQSYPHWEICVCEDACAEAWVSKYLEQLSRADSRVQFVRSAQRMGSASSLNRAGILTSGDYIALLDQHDVLAPHAFYYAAEALQDGQVELLYADDDQLGPTGARERPSFKPDWSPDLLDTTMYLGGFLVVSKAAWARAEGLQSEFDGAHLYDLALRLAAGKPKVRHLSRVVASLRARQSFPEQERRAIQAALQRRGCSATVEEGPKSFRIHRKLLGTPLASVIICSRTARLLGNCLEKIERLTSYPVREIVVVQHKTGDDGSMERLLDRSHCVRVAHAGAACVAPLLHRRRDAKVRRRVAGREAGEPG